MAVSEAIENYLETIYILSQQQNEVHAIDVCSYLSYSRPTVSIVLRQMRENGLVNVDEDNHIHLTEEGKRIATHIYERHTILSQLFMSLGVSKETALGISNALEIEPEELFDVIGTDKTLSPKTLLHYHRCLSAILSKAVKWGLLFSNPCERVDPPKLRRREAKCLNEEQTLKLIAALDEKGQYSVMVKLMIFSGARRAEICGLEWDDVDWDKSCIHICRNSLYLPNVGMYEDTTKTESSERYVKLPQSVMTILSEFRDYQNGIKKQMGEGWQESGKIFTQYNGLPIHPSSVTSWLRKFTERNGLPHVTPHMLRHTSATMLLMQGVPLKAVPRRLGHTLASTTSDIYGHSLRSVEDIAADKLEAMLSPSTQLKMEDK